MRTDIINKYIWLIDTISSHGTITRREINELWRKSIYGDGNDIPRRTFFNYRRDIERIFNIDILCVGDQYSISDSSDFTDETFRSWMLDAFALRGALSSAPEISSRIVAEKIPSARRHLTSILTAIQRHQSIILTYAGYSRSNPEADIVLRPQFVKLFRQRWYVIGIKTSVGEVRTYALDRILDLKLSTETFQFDSTINPATFFNDCFGITYSRGEVKEIVLRSTTDTAKYLRALPLHHTQTEQQYNDHSIFRIRLKITDDLIREILALVPALTVVSPPELKTAVTQRLSEALQNHNS